MHALGPALAGILAVTVPIAGHASEPTSAMTPVNAGPAPGIILVWDGGGSGQPVGQLVPIQRPVTCANGTVYGCRRIGGRTVTLADGVRMAGGVSLLTGSGVPAAVPSIIPSLIGAVRQAGGVIRSPGFGVDATRAGQSRRQPQRERAWQRRGTVSG